MGKHHKQILFDFLGIAEGDFVASELSGKPAVDSHAIVGNGRGGKKDDQPVENLIFLTRQEHFKFGERKQYKAWLYYRHLIHIQSIKPDYEINEAYKHYLNPSQEELSNFERYEIELKSIT